MRRSIQLLRSNAIEADFNPKRCVILYPADVPGWVQLINRPTALFPGSGLDFAFIGYTEKEKVDTTARPPFHLFSKKQLGPAYNLPADWFNSWSRPADLLLVANPAALPAIDLLAAQFPAFFRASVYATEFGELYSFVLQLGPDAPEDRLESLHAYLQKMMQL